MKICYMSHHMNDKGSGASQVSQANLELLRRVKGHENIETVCLSDLNYSNKIATKILIFLRSVFGYSSCLGFFSSNSFLESDLLKKSAVIWCDGSLYGPLIKKIQKKYPNKKIITFFHNIEVDFYQNIYPMDKLRYKLFVKSSKNNEKKAAIYSTTLITLTEQDKKRVEELYDKKVKYIIPVLFDSLSTFNIISSIEPHLGYKALFVGSDFPPNIEAIQFLCREVMPNVNDNISLTIVGKGMDKYKSSLENKNIKIYGFVDDLSILYQECDIVLSPIFSGAGMKVKIAEAFKHGKGVLGTEFSFQGYDIGKEFIFIANNEKDYINYFNNYKLKFNSCDVRSYYNDNFTISSKVKLINEILN